MSAEILKGYRLRKGIEDGQLLAKKGKDHYLFLLSFLSEPEAERFEENFSRDEDLPAATGIGRHYREKHKPS